MESKDNNNLLLLGLELLKNLNKSSKLPYAVVKPSVKPKVEEHKEDWPMSGNDRKRKHHGEVTEAEKKEKRRMMNRLAAQNARDKKKQHMEEIEKKLSLLEEQNKALALENEKLKQRTSILEAEKESLQNQLSTPSPDSSSFLPPSDQQQLSPLFNHLDLLHEGMAASNNSTGGSVFFQQVPLPSSTAAGMWQPSTTVDSSRSTSEPTPSGFGREFTFPSQYEQPTSTMVGDAQPWLDPTNEDFDLIKDLLSNDSFTESHTGSTPSVSAVTSSDVIRQSPDMFNGNELELILSSFTPSSDFDVDSLFSLN